VGPQKPIDSAAVASAPALDPAPAPEAPRAPEGDAAPPAPDPNLTQSAGRGGLAVAGAKIWFILVGFLQQTLLPRLIGLDGFGAFSIVLAVANIPNNVVTTASIQGVSRAVSEAGRAGEQSAQRRALRIHAVLAPCLAVPFFLAAPFIADFEHAPHVITPLRIFSAVLFIYAIYTPLVGALNGRRRFLAQAGLDVTFATLRTIGLLGAAYLFHRQLGGPTASASGVALAAAAILPIAFTLAGRGRAGDVGPTPRQHLLVLAPIALAQLFSNLLMQADIWLLARFAHESGTAAGVTGDALRIGTDKLIGAYRAAQLFAFLPTQLLLSITFILFPLVSRAHAEKDAEAVARYVRTGFRLGVVLAGLMVSCTSGLAPQLLRFAFPEEAAARASEALRILALGQGAFAIFSLETTVLVSLARERSSALLTAAAAAFVAVACALSVPSAPFDAVLLVRTALATSVALLVATTIGAALVRRTAQSFAPTPTLVRTALAVAAATIVGNYLPWHGRALVPVQAAIVIATYLAVSIATRELTRADLAMVRTILGRRRKPAA
jgi:stage V sporulation protein B